MGLIEEISQKVGREAAIIYDIYRRSYPPDLLIVLNEGGMIDFGISGGDIQIAGMSGGNHYKNVVWRATQDLLIKLIINKGSSVISPSFGGTSLFGAEKTMVPAIVAIAAHESPYIASLQSVSIRETADDEILVGISATTVTGDKLSTDVVIGGM